MTVCVTPSANKRVTISSAKRPNCSAPTGPVITTSVTRSLQPPLRISGSSALLGRLLVLSSANWTSSRAFSISVPGRNSSVMLARPSNEVERLSVTPSTASKTGSRTCTMAASTSSAPAPSQMTVMSTSSTTTSGKNCARMFGNATRPAPNIKIKNRFAMVRCRVK